MLRCRVVPGVEEGECVALNSITYFSHMPMRLCFQQACVPIPVFVCVVP